MRKVFYFAIWMLAAAATAAYAKQPVTGNMNAPKSAFQSRHYVTGTVSKITDDAVIVRTGEGGVFRDFSLKQAQREKVKGIKVGDPVTLELDEGDQIINIEKGVGSLDKNHSFVTGEVIGFEPIKRVVTLQLKDGTSKSYGMKDPAATKMEDIKKGAAVVLEIDKSNNLAEDVNVAPSGRR